MGRNVTADPAGAVKSYQSGQTTLSNATSVNVTIASVNRAKSMVILNATWGGTTAGAGYSAILDSAGQTSTNLRISEPNGAGSGTLYVSWQVVEYY